MSRAPGRAARVAVARGRHLPGSPGMRVLWDVMRTGQRRVLSGACTPGRAAREMQTEAERLLAER